MNSTETINELTEIITSVLHRHGMNTDRRVSYERGSAANGISYKLLYLYRDERGIEQQGQIIAHGENAKEIMIAARGMLEGLDALRVYCNA